LHAVVCSEAPGHLPETLVAVPERPEAVLFAVGLNDYAVRDQQGRVAFAQRPYLGEGNLDFLFEAKEIAVKTIGGKAYETGDGVILVLTLKMVVFRPLPPLLVPRSYHTNLSVIYIRPCNKILLSTAQDASSRMQPKFSPKICRTISSRKESSGVRTNDSLFEYELPEDRRTIDGCWCCCSDEWWGESEEFAGGNEGADAELLIGVSSSIIKSRLRRRPPTDSVVAVLNDGELNVDGAEAEWGEDSCVMTLLRGAAA